MEKLGIAIVSEIFLPGVSGTITAVRNLAEALRHNGHRITLIAPESPESADWAAQNEIVYLPLRGISMPARIGQRISLGLGTRRSDIRNILRTMDIVHLHSPFLAGLEIARIAHAERKRIVVTSHALPENIIAALRLPLGTGLPLVSAGLWKWMGKGIVLADALTSPSRYGAELIQRHFKRGLVRVISNGVEELTCPACPPDTIAPDEPFRALYVGRLQKEKRVDELLRVVKACEEVKISVMLTILGDGPDRRRLEALSQRLGVGSRVQFLGIVPISVRDGFYQRSHFLLMASRAELQCCAALEAMAAGRAVIAARAGALAETVPDRVAGRLYTPGDVTQVVEILREFRRDSNSYLRLCQGALTTAARHRLSNVCNAYCEIYASLIPSRSLRTTVNG